MIQDWRETAPEPAALLTPEDYEFRANQIVLRRNEAYRSSLHGLHLDERRTGKAAKLIELYARLNCVNL